MGEAKSSLNQFYCRNLCNCHFLYFIYLYNNSYNSSIPDDNWNLDEISLVGIGLQPLSTYLFY